MTTATGPLGLLRGLARDGLLAQRFPAVRGLLADMSTEDRARAGMVLARLDPDEVLSAHPDTQSARIAVTGHGTVATIVPMLAAETARHGMLLHPAVSSFDSYVFDLSNPDSDLYAHRPDVVLCLLDPTVVVDELTVPWTAQDAARTINAKVDLITGLARAHAARNAGTLVVTTIPLPASVVSQLVDLRSRASLSAEWRRANARLLDLTAELDSLVVLDVEPLLAGGTPLVDDRMSRYAKAHLSDPLLAAIARDVGHLTRMRAGAGKKCLAVDLDNTMWGGILGDDGVAGVEVGEGFAGEAFAAFQRVVKQLAAQGVLLAAVSKNDEDMVRTALAEHPGMVLRENDFVRIAANWRPKSQNLRELAHDLNIAIDALVFVDDSPFECGSVRHDLPGVAVVELDGEPALHPARLLADGWFTVRELTGTDLARPALYREELQRQTFLDTTPSLADYLAGLGIRVVLSVGQEADVSRLSQITLRTNQFNLTTRRLQPDEVRQWPGTVLTIRSADRFGDNGLVGAIFLCGEGDTLHVDNFLLSCRVFSRGIEDACIAAVLRHAVATGARAVSGTYLKSPKNGKVADFYSRHHFTPTGNGMFVHDLADLPQHPDHIHLTCDLTETRP